MIGNPSGIYSLRFPHLCTCALVTCALRSVFHWVHLYLGPLRSVTCELGTCELANNLIQRPSPCHIRGRQQKESRTIRELLAKTRCFHSTLSTTVPISGCGNIGKMEKGKRRTEREDKKMKIRDTSRKIINPLSSLHLTRHTSHLTPSFALVLCVACSTGSTCPWVHCVASLFIIHFSFPN